MFKDDSKEIEKDITFLFLKKLSSIIKNKIKYEMSILIFLIIM